MEPFSVADRDFEFVTVKSEFDGLGQNQPNLICFKNGERETVYDDLSRDLTGITTVIKEESMGMEVDNIRQQTFPCQIGAVVKTVHSQSVQVYESEQVNDVNLDWKIKNEELTIKDENSESSEYRDVASKRKKLKEQLTAAPTAVANGISEPAAAKKCKVPKTTSKNVASRQKYPKKQMADALEAVAKGMLISTAAKKFTVPRTTLLYKVSGRSPKYCQMGPQPILTSCEESLLVEWALSLAERQYPVIKDQLLDSVQLFIRNTKRETPFTDGRPGRKWFKSFLKRHPQLSNRVAQNLTPARENVTENEILLWFTEIEGYLKSRDLYNITNNPSRVFSSDEAAFFLQPKGPKVVARKGDRNIYSAAADGNDERENLSVLLTANANGDIAPPMIVFRYETIPMNIARSINENWAIGRSDFGWVCGLTFYEYIANVFVPWVNEREIEKPVLLFVDRHVSHMSLPLSEFCSENGIELLALYPNSCHLIQPMDFAVFKPLETFWKLSVNAWHMDNNGGIFKKVNFGGVFKEALSKITKESIEHGFKICGLTPFGANNDNFSRVSLIKLSTDKKSFDHQLLKQGLKVLENLISSPTLHRFKENENTDQWTGSVEDTSLFMVWNELNRMVSPHAKTESRTDTKPVGNDTTTEIRFND